MDHPVYIDYVRLAFILGAIALWYVGMRPARHREHGVTFFDQTLLNVRFLWLGLVVWSLGIIFGVWSAFVYSGVFSIVLSFVALAITGFLFWGLVFIQRKIRDRRATNQEHRA